MPKKQKFKIVDYLSVGALLQLQASGIDVSKQLRNKGKAQLIDFVPCTPEPVPEDKSQCAPRRSKYGVSEASERTLDGIVFDSKIEALVYAFLMDKHIPFTRQPEYVLQEAFVDVRGKKRRAIVYRGDFLIHGPDQDFLVDVKGMKTRLFQLKEKMLLKKFEKQIHCFKKVNQVFMFLADKKLIGPS